MKVTNIENIPVGYAGDVATKRFVPLQRMKQYVGDDSLTIESISGMRVHSCNNNRVTVVALSYRKMPDPYLYINFSAKTSNYTYVYLDDMTEARELAEDLMEAYNFINEQTS